MQTRFEHFAATSMLGSPDAPPRQNGALSFASEWERRAFGLALALAKEGYFEWEEFRQALIAQIGGWEASHSLDDPSWRYYERWLDALEHIVVGCGLIDEQTRISAFPDRGTNRYGHGRIFNVSRCINDGGRVILDVTTSESASEGASAAASSRR
jgi:nitrile hydratase accessory protein